MKLKRPINKILLVSAIVACFALLSMAAFYIAAVFPQLPEALEPQNSSKIILTSDKATNAVCEQLKNKSIQELHQASINYLQNKDYKTCFNINKLIAQKVPKDKKNSAILAGAYTDMGNFYRMVENTKAACEYSDIAVKTMVKDAPEGDYYFTHYKAGQTYFDNEVGTGFSNSKLAAPKSCAPTCAFF